MSDEQALKRLLYGDVVTGFCRQGGQVRRYKDTLKTSLKRLQINLANWREIDQSAPGLDQLLSPRPTLSHLPRRQLTLTTLPNPHYHPPPSSSSSVFSTSATAASVPTTAAHNPDTPANINPPPPTNSPSDVDFFHTFSHCHRTSTSHIGLVGHLRIHRTEADEPVPGAPTYTHCIRLHCSQCPRAFIHRVALFGRMHVHNTPNAYYTSTMPSSTHIPPPNTPVTISSTTFSISCTSTMLSLTHAPSSSASTISSSTTAKISEADTDTAGSSSPYCSHTRRACRSSSNLVFSSSEPDIRWGVGVDAGGEATSQERMTEAHQVVVDALRQTGHSFHDVVPNGKGDARASSPCPWATAQKESQSAPTSSSWPSSEEQVLLGATMSTFWRVTSRDSNVVLRASLLFLALSKRERKFETV
nr:unnamed protein product [Spirometra erinaceieuropaei]